MVSPKKRKSVSKSVKRKHAGTSSVKSGESIGIGLVRTDVSEDDAIREIWDDVVDYSIIATDDDGKITRLNKGAEKLTGFAPPELKGKNFQIFFTKEDRDAGMEKQLMAEAKEKSSVTYEGWQLRKNGISYWSGVTITRLQGKGGTMKGFLIISQDLSVKKIAEDRTSNAIEELRLKNEALQKSEDRYHKMISEVQDYAIILLDRDGKILDWNKGAANVKGYSAQEIIGKSFRLFYPREEKEAKLPERLLDEAVKKGNALHEGWRLRKDGTRFWGLVSITALRDQAGDIIGFSKVTLDLTERKIIEDKVNIVVEELRQANEQLTQSEERYHKMIAEVQDYAIILLDVNGNIQNWNTGAQFIKGYSAREAVGKNFRIFYTQEDRVNKLPESLLEEARRNGKVTHDGWRVKKDGSHFWGSVVITSLHDSNDKLIGFSKVTRDLTERKKAEDALKVSAAQLDLKNKTLERLNDELSSFTYVASHDLKEPLRKIQSFASKIEHDGYTPETGPELILKIKRSAAGMQNLIEDLLSYSQVSSEIAGFEKIDLNDVLQDVQNDLEITIKEKEAVIDAVQLPIINGVKFQLHQLFLNLISNGLKFSKEPERPVIKIRVREIKGPDIPLEPAIGNNRYYHFSVKDNGIGFSSENATRIFEAFQRLHPKHIFAGTGLGLAIVKKVVENHHGIISADSEPGKGATFNIYLPVGTEA